MLVQDFLRGGGTLDQLLERYAITAKRHKEHPELVLLKYDQIESPFKEPLVQECRGLILNEADNWKVICHTFSKFFNLGEGLAAPIDWKTARVLEKLDGSLCQVYFYDGAWQVATSGTPDASGEVNGTGQSFEELFWDTWNEQFPDGLLGQGFTYAFELTGVANRVVVQHKGNRLTLLAVRNNDTGLESLPELWKDFPVVRSFPFTDLDQVSATLTTMKGLEQEGYVVVDGNWNRVKIKCQDYIKLHKLRDGMSPRRVLDVVRTGEMSEVLTAFPEWKDHFESVSKDLDALCQEVQNDFDRLKGIPVQKDFALEAVKTKCSAALFQMRRGTFRTPKAYFASVHIDNLAKLLGYKTEPEGPGKVVP